MYTIFINNYLLGTSKGSSKSGCEVSVYTLFGTDLYLTFSFSAVNSLCANSAIDKNS